MNRIKILFSTLLLTLFTINLQAQNSCELRNEEPLYLNTSYSFEERAADLVSRLTPEEKQTLLGNTMYPIPRLGINKYDVWGEALHGIVGRNDNAGTVSYTHLDVYKRQTLRYAMR